MTKATSGDGRPSVRSILLLILLSVVAWAQAPGVQIVDQSKEGLKSEENAIIEQLKPMVEKECFPDIEQIRSAIEHPPSAQLRLPEPRTKRISAARIAEYSDKSSYRVGWGYLCENCDRWHIELAGGYAVSDHGVIATCAHVIDLGEKKIRKGGLIAVGRDGRVHPINAILAYDKEMDAALVSIDAETFALPLSDNVRPGDPAFCLSRPLGQKDYFSKGMVNRFYWDDDERGNDESSPEALAHLKLNVSSRWAPGSSGSPVLDRFGNAIGHVALIHTLTNGSPRSLKGKETKSDGRILITLHTATPARSIRSLAGCHP